jgi:hypothetical protein
MNASQREKGSPVFCAFRFDWLNLRDSFERKRNGSTGKRNLFLKYISPVYMQQMQDSGWGDNVSDFFCFAATARISPNP